MKNEHLQNKLKMIKLTEIWMFVKMKHMKGLDKERPPDDVENFQVKEVMMVMKWNT